MLDPFVWHHSLLIWQWLLSYKIWKAATCCDVIKHQKTTSPKFLFSQPKLWLDSSLQFICLVSKLLVQALYRGFALWLKIHAFLFQTEYSPWYIDLMSHKEEGICNHHQKVCSWWYLQQTLMIFLLIRVKYLNCWSTIISVLFQYIVLVLWSLTKVNKVLWK